MAGSISHPCRPDNTDWSSCIDPDFRRAGRLARRWDLLARAVKRHLPGECCQLWWFQNQPDLDRMACVNCCIHTGTVMLQCILAKETVNPHFWVAEKQPEPKFPENSEFRHPHRDPLQISLHPGLIRIQLRG